MGGADLRVDEVPHDRLDRPAADEIRAQLERVECSREFDAPDRVRRFLHYVVEEALAGRSDRIKAYPIALEVFGRSADFDARNDPIVRIEAGRLRRALERYYLLAGRTDPVSISIPKGGYAPAFAFKTTQPVETLPPDPVELSLPPLDEGPAARPLPWLRWTIAAVVVLITGLLGAGLWPGATDAWRLGPDGRGDETGPAGPSVLVRPFANLGGDAEGALYAAGLTDEVLSQLARFKELRVVGRETTKSLSATAGTSDIPADLGVRYILEGTVRTSAHGLRVNTRVLAGESAVVLWAHTYEADLTSGNIVGIVVDVAGQVASTVAQPYGIIFQADESRALQRAPDDLAAYTCTLRFYQYRAVLSAEEHAAVRDCLERAVARYPKYGTAWAMLSFLYLDEDRFQFNPKAGEPPAIERALEAARHSVRIDQDNIRALQALMTALFFTGEPAEAFRIGERALALNPNDTELLGEFGTRVALAGDWKRGSELLEKALDMNPGNSGFYAGMLALAAFIRHDNARAVTLIRQADLRKFPIFHLVAALIYAEAGLEEEGAKSRARFLEMQPRFFDAFDAELAKRNFRAEDRRFMTEAARKAGFPVP